jgi:Ser/Thr protein kinase RdoA (MazF antagonist)
MDTAHPFASLTPECVLDALDSVGQFSDGRLLALNSYENRVYQVGMEEGAPVVVKFYRPERWSDAAILEEHAFVDELVAREIPVVPALAIGGATLHTFQGFRFAVLPRRGGRAPELDDSATLEWMGRFIGRIHAVGALAPDRERPALDIDSFGIDARDYLIANNFIPPELMSAWRSVIDQALDGCAAATPGPARCRCCACMAIVTAATSCGPRTAPISSISTTAAWGRPCKTCGCCSRASAATWCANCPTCWPATRISATSTPARCTWSKRCARCA